MVRIEEMKIAIVGTSLNLSENQERDIRQHIGMVLQKYDVENDIIISGGAKGVDSIALEIAENLGFEVLPFDPIKQKWSYYRKRNIEIAEECDKLYCFTIPVKSKKCYHHDELMDHEKTAGCYTAQKAFELNKPCQLIVVLNRG